MDHLRMHGSTDYAAALENNLTWSWSGTPGMIPRPATAGRDGTDSVTFPALDAHGISTTSALGTAVSGPGIISFWWKGYRMDCLKNGVEANGTFSQDWTRAVLRLDAGPNTLKWQTASQGGWAASGALDEVRPGSAFENGSPRN